MSSSILNSSSKTSSINDLEGIFAAAASTESFAATAGDEGGEADGADLRAVAIVSFLV